MPNVYQRRATSGVPQSEPIPGQEHLMKQNNAGGFSYTIDSFKALERFLVLGVEGGTYYVDEDQLLSRNLSCVDICVKENPVHTANLCVEISKANRAISQSPIVVTAAHVLNSGSEAAKKIIIENLHEIARIPTHFFLLVRYLIRLRNGSKSGIVKHAIRTYYGTLPDDKLIYHVLKYRSRGNITHRDLLRIAHPVPKTPVQTSLFRFIVAGKNFGPREVFKNDRRFTYPEVAGLENNLFVDFTRLQENGITESQVVEIISNNRSITWEMLPTELLNSPNVLRALLPNLPFTALLRFLNRLSAADVLKPLSAEEQLVVNRLTDPESISKSRVHPFAILLALKAYTSGGNHSGMRTKLKWEPSAAVRGALETALETACNKADLTGKRLFVALDVSGSMRWTFINGTLVDAAEASAVLAKVHAREQSCFFGAFATEFVPIDITAHDSYSEILRKMSSFEFGGTDCAQPMLYALEHRIPDIDAFIVYTDSETWVGKVHPSEALKQYRQRFNKEAKLIVVGMTATEFSIAKPDDPGMLDVVGFDTKTPEVIREFIVTP